MILSLAYPLVTAITQALLIIPYTVFVADNHSHEKMHADVLRR